MEDFVKFIFVNFTFLLISQYLAQAKTEVRYPIFRFSNQVIFDLGKTFVVNIKNVSFGSLFCNLRSFLNQVFTVHITNLSFDLIPVHITWKVIR